MIVVPLLFLIITCIMLRLRAARNLASSEKAFVTVAAAYSLIAYAVVPILLLVLDRLAITAVYDPRLFAPGRDYLVEAGLKVVALGEFSLLVGVLLLSRGKRIARVPTLSTELALTSLGAAVAALSFTWIVRIAVVSSGGSVSTLGLAALASLPAVAVVAFLYRGDRVPMLLGICLISEILWTVLTASKSPIFAILLALLMRPSERSAMRPSRLIAFSLATLATFIVVQPLKGITSSQEAAASYGGSGLRASILGNLMGAVQRFDGFTRVTDALLAFPTGGWLSPTEYLRTFLSFAFAPVARGNAEPSLGQLWTQQVRTVSVPTQVQEVPLAFGPYAEGFAISGWLGVFFFALAYSIAGLALARAIRTSRPGVLAFASYYLFSGALFERSVLGLAAGLPVALSVAILVASVSSAHRSLSSRRQRAAVVPTSSLAARGGSS